MKTLLASLYGTITALRNRAYDRGLFPVYRSKLPVVSVGNLSAGGNGKTPLCIYLAELLKREGFAPVILSRGYGGSKRGPHLLTKNDTPDQVGDEPLLLMGRAECPVVIARNRAAGAKFIEAGALGNIIILDDGLQHRRLARDLDIVAVNSGSTGAVDEFVDGKLLPAGLFREEREGGLRRAGLVVLSQRSVLPARNESEQRIRQLVPQQLPVCRAFVRPANIHSVSNGGELATREVVAFCGIANPEGFFHTLEQLGFSLLGKEAFPDHYSFQSRDVHALQARYPGRALVCTEKDAIKLEPLKISGLYALSIATEVEPAELFDATVLGAVRKNTAAPSKTIAA